MEEDDVDFDEKPGQSTPVEDREALGMCEDSVDIYEDLAKPSSPIPFEHGEGGVAFDLLEELLIEETSLKVRTHEELCQKFEESQQQIEVFTKTMKTVQEQNTVLLSQNEQLKKNICALFKTAKAEINRKDDEIRRLHSSLTSLKCAGSWRRHAAQHERTQQHERAQRHESRFTRTLPPATVVASSSRHNGQYRRDSSTPEEAVEPDASQTDGQRVDPTARHRVSASDKTSALDSSAKTPSDQSKRLSVYQSESRLDQAHRPRLDRTLSHSERSVKSHLEQSKSRLDQSDTTRLEHSDKSRAAWSDKPHSNRIKPCLGQSDKADVRRSKYRLDQSDTSRVDQSTSRVDQSKFHSDKSKSRVDRADRSRVHQADKSCVGQSRSRVDQSRSHSDKSKSRVDQAKSHVDQATSHVDQADKSHVDQAKSHVDQSRSRVDQTTSRVDQSRSRVDQATSRVDQATSRVDQSRSRVDQATSHVDQATSRVDQATSRVDQADRSHIDQAKSHVDQSRSRVDQAKSHVNQADKSRVDQAKSHVDKAKSHVDHADMSRVDQATSRVDQADKSHVDQAKSHVDQSRSRVDQADKSHVDQATSRVDQADKSHVDQATSRVDQATSHVDQSRSRVDQSRSRVDQATSHVDQATSHVDQATSHVDQSRSRVDQATSRVDQNTSHVDQADMSRVDQATSRVDQATSRVDQADKSHVDQATSRVDQADMSRVDQATSRVDQTTSRVDQADKSHVDQSRSRVDQTTSRVDQATSRVDQSRSRVDQATSHVDQATSRVDQSRSRVDQATSRVDQSRSRVDQATSHVDQSRSRVDQATSHVDQATSHVDQATSRVDQADMSHIDQAKSHVDQAKSRVNQATSRVDHADMSRVDQADKSHVDQAKSHVDQAKSRVDQSRSRVEQATSHVDQADMSRVDQATSRVDQSKSRVDQADMSRVDQSRSRVDKAKSRVDQATSRVDQSRSRVDKAKSRVDQADKSHVNQADKSHVDQAKSRVDQAKSHVDQSRSRVDKAKSHVNQATSRVDQAHKSHVDQATSHVDKAKSHVDQAKSHVDQAKSHVDQSRSRVDKADKSHVDQAKSRVDQAKSRVDQADKSHVGQADKSCVDQVKSHVDKAKSHVVQADKSRVDHADKSHVDQAKSHVDQAKSHVDQADKSHVGQADKSRVDQAKSRVDQAKSHVDQAKSRVDQAKSHVDKAKSHVVQAKSRVDQADTSRVDQADKSSVDQSRSRVDQAKSHVYQADKSRVDQSVSRIDQAESRVDQAKSHVDQSVTRVDPSKSHLDQCDEVLVDRSKSQLYQSNDSPSDHPDMSCPAQFDTPHVEQHNSRLEQSESSLVHTNRSHIDYCKTQSVQPEQLHIDQSNITTSDNSKQHSGQFGKPYLDESRSRSDQSPKSHFNQSSILNPKQSAKPHTHLSDPHTDDASKAHLHQSERPHSDCTEKSCSHHPKPHMDEAAKAVESISEQPIPPNSLKGPPLSVYFLDLEQHVESLASALNQDVPIATSLVTPQAPAGGRQLLISQPELSHCVELRGKGGGTPRPGQASQAQTRATEGSTKNKSENKAAPMHDATEDPTEITVDLRLLLQALSLDRLCEGDDEKQSVPSCPSEVGTGKQGHEKRSVRRSGESGGRGDCDQVTPRKHIFQLAVTAHDHRAKEHERSRDSITEEAHKSRVRQLKSKSGFPDATTGQTDRNIMDYSKHSLHGTDRDAMPSDECSATHTKASTSSTIYNQERQRQTIESSGPQCWSLDGADGKEREQRSKQDMQSYERNDGGRSHMCDGTREGLIENNRKEKMRGERSHRVDKCQRPRDSHCNADASEQRYHGSKGSKRRVGERKGRPADDFVGCSSVCEVRYRRDGSAEKYNARHKAKVDKRGSAEGRKGKDGECGRGNLHKNREGESSLPRESTSSASRKKISAEKERSKEKLKRSGGSAVRTPGKMQEHSHSVCAKSSPKHEFRGRKFNSARNVVGINDPRDGVLPDDLRQRWGSGAEQLSFSALSEFARRSEGTFSWCLAPEGVTEPPTSPPAIIVEQSSSVAEASELNNSASYQPDNMDDLVVVDEFILENSGDSNSEADRDGGDGDGLEESVEIWHAHSGTTVDQHAGLAEHSEILAKRDSEGISALVQQEFSEGHTGDAALGDVALAAGRPSWPFEHHSQQDDVVVTLERNVSAATSRDSEVSPERTEAVQTPRKIGGSAEEVPELKQSKVTFMSSLSLALSPQRGIRAKNVDSDSAGVVVAAAAVVEVATAPSSQTGPPATVGKRAEDAGSRDKYGTDPAGPLEDLTKSILSGHLREEFPCAAAMPLQNSGSVKESTSDKPPEVEDDSPEEGEIVSDTEPEDIPQDTCTQDTKGSSSRANCTTTTAASPAKTTTAVITTAVASVADRAALPVRRNKEAAIRCRSASANPRGNKKWPGKLSRLNGYASQKHGRFPNRSCRQELKLRKRSHLSRNPPTGPTKQNDRSKVNRPGNKNQQPEQALLTMQSILNELESVRKLVHSTYPSSSTEVRDPPLFEILDYAEKQSVDTLNKFNWCGQDGSKMELCSLIRKSIGQLKNNTNFERLFSGHRPHETGVLLRLLDKEFDILFNNIQYTLCLQQLGSRPHNASRMATRRRSVKSMSAEQCGTVSGRDERERPKHTVGGKASVATASPARSLLASTRVHANLKVYKIPKYPNGVLRCPVERRDPVCMPHFTEGMAPVQNSTLQSLKLGVMSMREPRSQLKRKMCSEVEVISTPVKISTPVGKRRKIEPEGNFDQTVKGFKSVAGNGDNCGSAAQKKTEAVSSGGKSGSHGSSGSGNGGSDGRDVIVHGNFALEGVAEDVETTSVELDECPVTPGKSMFGPDMDKATEPPDSAEASRVSELQSDKSSAVETPQEPPPVRPSLHFTLCTESNMGDELMSLLGVNRQILKELSVARSPEVQVTYPCLECSESLPSSDSVDTSCDKSRHLKSPNSTFSTCHERTNWDPPISSILLADLEVSNSLLSPLKDSYRLASCAMPLPSDGLKFVSLPAACYSENAQFDEEESDFHLALDTESPSEDGDSGQKFSPLKNRAPKEGFFEIVTHEAPQSQKSREADTDFRLHSECEGVSKKWQVPFEEESDGGKPKEEAEKEEEEAEEEAEEEEEELSKTPEPHGCKRRRHSKSPVTAKQDGNKNKCKKPRASETNLVLSPESEKHSVGPESTTSGRNNKSSMPSSVEELLTPEKGHRRKRKKTKSRRSSVNVVELGEEARSSLGEEPPRKGKKRSCCSASPDKVILAKNVVKKHGEVVLLWTRDDDRLILSEVQRHGPSPDIFSSVAALLGDKTGSQVSRRYRELLKLFQKAAEAERLTNEAFAKLQSDSDAMQESDRGSSPPPAAHAPRC